jgi:hypothetical protein
MRKLLVIRNKQPKIQQLQAARTQQDIERFPGNAGERIRTLGVSVGNGAFRHRIRFSRLVPRALPARMMWRWGISR